MFKYIKEPDFMVLIITLNRAKILKKWFVGKTVINSIRFLHVSNFMLIKPLFDRRREFQQKMTSLLSETQGQFTIRVFRAETTLHVSLKSQQPAHSKRSVNWWQVNECISKTSWEIPANLKLPSHYLIRTPNFYWVSDLHQSKM